MSSKSKNSAAVKKTEHWSKLKMKVTIKDFILKNCFCELNKIFLKIILPEKMNSIDQTGIRQCKSGYDKVYTFQELVKKELAESFPGKDAIQIYAVGPRTTE